MSKKHLIMVLTGVFLLSVCTGAWAADPDVAALVRELQALKARVTQLETQLTKAQTCADDAQVKANQALTKAASAATRSLKVSQQIQTSTGPGVLSELTERISVAGGVEAELFYQSSEDASESRLELALAEIIFGIDIHKYAKGVIHFIWEHGDEAIRLDEGFVVLGQADDMPFYFMAGLMYPAIGTFDSYFVSDPLTLEAFETNATAFQIGYEHEWFSVGVGGYNADVHDRGDGDDNNFNTFFARLNVTPPAEMLGGVSVTFGAAYTNNIATNNGLAEAVAGSLVPDDDGNLVPSEDNTLNGLVGGYSLSVLVEYGMFALAAEYISAASSFTAADLVMDNGAAAPQPYAYNIELAVMPIEPLTLAARFGGSGDMYGLLPKTQYGLAAAYEIFEHVTLAVEYLHSDFDGDVGVDRVTGQLAVNF